MEVAHYVKCGGLQIKIRNKVKVGEEFSKIYSTISFLIYENWVICHLLRPSVTYSITSSHLHSSKSLMP